MASTDELKRIFKEAAAVAAEVPEALREAAFQRALDALMPQASPAPAALPQQVAIPATRAARVPGAERSGAVTKLLESLNRTELAALLSGRKVLDRALLILKAAQNHHIEALGAGEISQILTQKFREPATASAVRMALDRKPEYTDRRPEGGGFVYTLMAPGERYIDDLGREQPDKGSSARRRAPTTRKADRKSGDSARKNSKARVGKSGRPGPKAMLETLLSEGYFATARILSEIISHIEVKKTHRYATSDFTATLQRLVREKKLDRIRNAQEQYEYKAA